MTDPTHINHTIRLGRAFNRFHAREEDVRLTFPTQRGSVHIVATTYRAHDGSWSSWNIHIPATEAGLTIQSDVDAWLASEAYKVSRQRAYVAALKDMALHMKPYDKPPSRDLRQAIESATGKIPFVYFERLFAAADAYDRFVHFVGEL
jgi:hypothetical protein